MITRKSLADEIDQYDQQIADMNSGKKDCFDAYRDQLSAAGMAKPNIKIEVEAVKAAIKRRRAAEKDPTALEEKDALTDEIFWEITSAHAPRATRVENIEQFSSYASAKGVDLPAHDEDGVILEPNPEAKASEGNGTQEPHDGEGVTGDASRPSVGGGSDATISPETATGPNDDMAVVDSIDVHGDTGSGMARTEASAVTAGETATNSQNTPDPRPLTAADGQPGIQSSSPGAQKDDRSPPVVGQGCESGGIYTGSIEEQAVTQFEPPAFLVANQQTKTMRDFRPHCQKPDACGASGLKHCYTCSKLVPQESEVA